MKLEVGDEVAWNYITDEEEGCTFKKNEWYAVTEISEDGLFRVAHSSFQWWFNSCFLHRKKSKVDYAAITRSMIC